MKSKKTTVARNSFRVDQRRPSILMETRTRVGDLIREHRIEAKLERKDLAIIIGCSASAVASWEHGLSLPHFDLVPMLCRTLRIPIYALMGIDPSAVSPLTPDEKTVVDRYAALTEHNKRIAISLMEQLLKKQELDARLNLRRNHRVLFEPDMCV